MAWERSIRVKTDQTACGYRVSGVVQGVGFRYWTQRQARQLGLGGYVRNARDGSVEVFAAGPAGGLEELRRILQRGPAGALVNAVELLPPPLEPLPELFEIRH
jgi:acylphosphatase